MVLDYYKLREEPFGVTPDSRYLFSSATHREALASLLYGVEAGRGFVALIARPGMGKTTLLFHALHQLREKARTVFLFQTIGTPVDFLRALLADLGVDDTQGTLIDLQSKLNDVLAEQSRSGKRLVVVIDEAQNLDDSVLELVRMLSNFETSREKLIQIILSGQPQLADKLRSPGLVQLRQRISIVAGLQPLSPEETGLYIGHRMRAAGYGFAAPLFTRSAVALIARSSEGIPRNINNLCFNALSLGCALERRTIESEVVREVIADLDLEPLRAETAPQAPVAISLVAARSMLPVWLPKLAVATAVLLAFIAMLFESMGLQHDRWAVSKTAVQANSIAAPLAAATPSSFRREGSPRPAAPAGTVRVTPGETLSRICVENFGSCGPGLLEKIHELNPWLSDLDHIESGQNIRIPAAGKSLGDTQNIGELPDEALPAERRMQ